MTVRWILVLLVFAGALAVRPGPVYPPTSGEAWPKPQQEHKLQNYYTYDTSNFKIEVTGYNCSILWNAIHRYSYVARELQAVADKYKPTARSPQHQNETHYSGPLRLLRVNLTQPCQDNDMPHAGMDENYWLSVAQSSELRAATMWGVLRGLETFAQLFYLDNHYFEVRINGTEITDSPRYGHRGLLVDTSRHFISLATLRGMLDAMAINKMNVFHWHIVDDQSFPYQSDIFPELSEKGAYHTSMVYSGPDIASLVEYARDRGIRVIPEFDVPGHTRSWGEAYPNMLTQCYQSGSPVGLGPLHPLRNNTYKLLQQLLQEVQSRFPDNHFHLGGDEVDLSCWLSNPELVAYMRQHNMTDAGKLHALFMRNALPLLATDTKPIVWQEVFDEGVHLSNDTLIHVWKTRAEDMINVLESGFSVVYSTEWYLDHLGDTFETFLKVDPRAAAARRGGNQLAQLVIGGEACMWAERVDDANIMPRVWPRASAVAERLWSPGLPDTEGGGWRRWRSTVPAYDLRRAEEHACRMRRRGVPAEPPSAPGYCLL